MIPNLGTRPEPDSTLFTPGCLQREVGERTFHGVSVWSKPTKFNVSFALHIATLMVFLSLLRKEVQSSAAILWTMIVTCTMVVAELLYISFQAARGRASHFNLSTAWEEFAYYAMGAGVALVMIGTLIIGLSVWRNARPDIGPALRLGVGLGATLGTIATLLTAGAMSSLQFTPTGHWVGGELSDANGLPIVGWSTTGGDLRAPHFFATHLIQALPIAGWLADRLGLSHPRIAVGIVSVLGLVLVWFTFQQALSGRPLLSLFGWQ
jgi:hypothetical protein